LGILLVFGFTVEILVWALTKKVCHGRENRQAAKVQQGHNQGKDRPGQRNVCQGNKKRIIPLTIIPLTKNLLKNADLRQSGPPNYHCAAPIFS
jgi:hypothetical protein